MIFESDCHMRTLQPIVQPNHKYRNKLGHFLCKQTLKTLGVNPGFPVAPSWFFLEDMVRYGSGKRKLIRSAPGRPSVGKDTIGKEPWQRNGTSNSN